MDCDLVTLHRAFHANNSAVAPMQLRLLRLILGLTALGWIVCIVGVFASWPQVNTIAQGLGAKPIAYDPMLDYWLRMICGAFTLVGIGISQWRSGRESSPRPSRGLAGSWFWRVTSCWSPACAWASGRFPFTAMSRHASSAGRELCFCRVTRNRNRFSLHIFPTIHPASSPATGNFRCGGTTTVAQTAQFGPSTFG